MSFFILIRNYFTIFLVIIGFVFSVVNKTQAQVVPVIQENEVSSLSEQDPTQKIDLANNTEQKILNTEHHETSKERISQSLQQDQENNQIVTIEADEQRKEGDLLVAHGYVNILYQGARLQADHATYNEKTGDAIADGNVIYDPSPNEHVTAHHAEVNIHTKQGFFLDTMGHTTQSSDGTLIDFKAERVDKINENTYVLYNASVTSCCEDTIPLWTISSGKTKLQINKRVTAYNGTFRVKGKPVLYLPFISLPLDKKDRQSGFLIPTTGASTNTGRFFRNYYYQTLGDSADILFRGDIYSKRGIGVGATFRAKTSENSYIKLGSYTVIDRIFGEKADEDTPNQGGTLFFAQGVHHLPHGFLGVVDVNFTSSLDFRSIFANDIEEAFNPEKRSQVYLNNNFKYFTFNLIANNRTTRINVPQQDKTTQAVDINIRYVPSLEVSAFPTPLKNTPIYLSGQASWAGLRREEIANGTTLFKTPHLIQRIDVQPKVTLPIISIPGLAITPSLALRSTYYSDVFSPTIITSPSQLESLQISTTPFTKKASTTFRDYLDFSLDIRPLSLEKIFLNKEGNPKFKHIIEPYITYRKLTGIHNFNKIPRFDEVDTFTNTNEIEYSLVNRFLVPRHNNKKTDASGKEIENKTTPAREIFSIALTQKYFFDSKFSGALVSGARNQIEPIMNLSGFNFGGKIRRFSPLNLKIRANPTASMFTDLRLDYDTAENLVRGFGVAGGVSYPNIKFQERLYYSKKIEIEPGKFEPGTFAGNQLISSIDLGNQSYGLYGGLNLSYNFSKPLDIAERNGLIRSGGYLGYAFRCAGLEVDYRSINLGIATSGKLTFSFTLRGIGTFGTDQLKQSQNR